MNTKEFKILKGRLWDQRIKLRAAIRNQNFQINKIETLNELDELYLIENEILQELRKNETRSQ